MQHFIRKKKQGKKKNYNVRSAMKVGRLEEKNSGLEIVSLEVKNKNQGNKKKKTSKMRVFP